MMAHLYDINAASASTSSEFVFKSNLIPPFVGSICSEWTERHPSNVNIFPLSLTPNRTVYVELQIIILFDKSSDSSENFNAL